MKAEDDIDRLKQFVQDTHSLVRNYNFPLETELGNNLAYKLRHKLRDAANELHQVISKYH